MVGISTGRMSSEAAPFGASSNPASAAKAPAKGLEDYLEMKYLCMRDLRM